MRVWGSGWFRVSGFSVGRRVQGVRVLKIMAIRSLLGNTRCRRSINLNIEICLYIYIYIYIDTHCFHLGP